MFLLILQQLLPIGIFIKMRKLDKPGPVIDWRPVSDLSPCEGWTSLLLLPAGAYHLCKRTKGYICGHVGLICYIRIVKSTAVCARVCVWFQ